MNRTIKKTVIVLLSIIIISSALPSTAFASELATPTKLTASTTTTTASLKWSKAKNADGYAIYRYYLTNKKSKRIATTSKTSYKVTKLKAGTTYTYYIRAYRYEDGKGEYSKRSNMAKVSTRPNAVSSIKISKTGESYTTLSFSKVDKAKKYLIKYSTSKDFAEDTRYIRTKSTKATVSDLASGTKYYIKIYAYRTVDKKNYYSKASKVVAIKTTESPAKVITEATTMQDTTVATTTTKPATTTTTTTTTKPTTTKPSTTKSVTDAEGWITKSY